MHRCRSTLLACFVAFTCSQQQQASNSSVLIKSAQRHWAQARFFAQTPRHHSKAYSECVSAVASYEHAAAADASASVAVLEAAHLRAVCHIYAVDTADASLRDSVVLAVNRELAASVTASSVVSQLIALLWLPTTEGLPVKLARSWASAFSLPAHAPPAERDDRGEHEPLRVAFLSAHFRDHPVGHHIGSVLRSHGVSFRTTAACFYASDAVADEHTARLMGDCPTFFTTLPCSPSTSPSVASAIQRWGADVLVLLDGYDSKSCMGVASLRPASRIISFFGFLHTTGAAYVDDIVVDDVAYPIDDGDAQIAFSERPLRGPRSFFAQDYARVYPQLWWANCTVASVGLEAQGSVVAAAAPLTCSQPPRPSAFAFCAFNQLFRVTGDVFRAWMRILLATSVAESDGLLLLPRGGPHLYLIAYPPIAPVGMRAHVHAYAAQLLRAWVHKLRAEGVDDAAIVPLEASAGSPAHDAAVNATAQALLTRLHFQTLLPFQEHLVWKATTCSLGLDTPYYNGHTSTADLLAAGVPVLTLQYADSGFQGRAAASLIAAAGGDTHFFVQSSLPAYEAAATAYHAAYVHGAGTGTVPLDAGDGRPWRPFPPTAPLFDTTRWGADWEDMLLHAAGR